MSYHTQQNTQQKSLGLFVVIAFHAMLIGGLISGLTSTLPPMSIPQNTTVQIIEKKADPIDMPVIIDIDTSPSVFKKVELPITKPITIDIEQPIKPNDAIVGQTDKVTPTTSNITKPKLIKASKPEYPSASTRLNEEGVTGLSLLVTANGRVTDVKLESTSGSDRLDAAAIKHAQHNWAFSPCTENGVAVACRFQTKLVWELNEAR
ncbi:MAG: energy transducer TonB [Pseudomonadota bacterium]